MQFISNSTQDTLNFGLKLAKKSKGGDIYALIGDLGGGKTCFTKGFARGLGIKKTINSPSFLLMKVYKVNRPGIKFFCHVDVYRLKRPGEIVEIGVEEYLGRPDTITIIEWADKIKKLLTPHKKAVATFSLLDKNSRLIKFKNEK